MRGPGITGLLLLSALSACCHSAAPTAPTTVAAPTPPPTAPEPAPAESIGSATMEADGTIVLQLRAVTGASIGDALLRYPPDHPKYKEILDHVGPIKPGETRPVAPFP